MSVVENSAERGMTVLAVDDEVPALEDLVHLLGADDHVDTVLTASDATADLSEVHTPWPGRSARRSHVALPVR